jgi:hypothetical protein
MGLMDSISFEHHRVCAKDTNLPALRSDFVIVKVTDTELWLVDHSAVSGRMSVTNDAERVVTHLLKHYPNRRYYYRDTDGKWDELIHNGINFVRFGPARDKEIAT